MNFGGAEPVPAQAFSERDIAALNNRLAGDAVHSRHADYEDVRRIWNYLIDRRPGVVVRAVTDADVATAIEFAREHGVRLTVRGGGHSLAGYSVVDGGVVIDLGRMRQVTVDPEAGRVRVGGGCLSADVDRATQVFGLATPFGTMSQTGVGGLALGGGMGWLTRKYGLTCDNLISARVVLADGSAVIANAAENSDLYWGLRGAGANFGVVTEFEFATHHVGPTVSVGTALFRRDHAAEVLTRYDQVMSNAPDDFKVVLYLRRAFAEPGVPDDLVGEPVLATVSIWLGGDAADARDINEELWGTAPRVFADISPTPFFGLQSINDELLGPGMCNYTKGGYLGGLTADCIDILLCAADRLPWPLSVVEISYQHGAQDRLDAASTAFADRHAEHFINVLSRWNPDDDRRPLIDWTRETLAATSRWQSGGVYTNFLATDDDHRVKDAYRGGKYERLAVIKHMFDPDNVFRGSPNIKPVPAKAPN